MGDRSKPTLALTEWPDDTYLNPRGAQIGRLLDRISIVIGQIYELLAKPESSASWPDELAEAARNALALEQEVRRFYTSYLGPWKHRSIYVCRSSLSSAHLVDLEPYPRRVIVYESPRVSISMMTIHTASIRLLQGTLDSVAMLTSRGLECSTTFLALRVHARMLEKVDDICSSVPFLLGDVDKLGNLCIGSRGGPVGALNAIYPLHLAASVHGTSDEQYNWIMGQLQRFGVTFGIKQGSVFAEHHRSRRLEQPLHSLKIYP